MENEAPSSPSDDTAENTRLGSAERLAERLDRPMGVLGIVFLFVVLGQVLAEEPVLVAVFTTLGWLFWAIFVAEFLLRGYIAGFGRAFWVRNWWQVIFLLVPFLRFFRALATLRSIQGARLARLGGVLSAGVRGSRSAGGLLSSRIGWLLVVTAVVILGASQLLYVTSEGVSYADALFQSAMATITGTGLEVDTGFGRVLQVFLAIYSVVVFAGLAGALGAFFLHEETRRANTAPSQSEQGEAVRPSPPADR